MAGVTNLTLTVSAIFAGHDAYGLGDEDICELRATSYGCASYCVLLYRIQASNIPLNKSRLRPETQPALLLVPQVSDVLGLPPEVTTVMLNDYCSGSSLTKTHWPPWTL